MKKTSFIETEARNQFLRNCDASKQALNLVTRNNYKKIKKIEERDQPWNELRDGIYLFLPNEISIYIIFTPSRALSHLIFFLVLSFSASTSQRASRNALDTYPIHYKSN
jgi:hypothetical protein